MPTRETIQTAGDYDLGEVAILGSSGEVVNITEQVQELNIFQAVDSPFMYGSIMINDAVGAKPGKQLCLVPTADQLGNN